MTILRPYQNTFVDNVIRLVWQVQHAIACMATGGGKSKCFINIAGRAVDKGFTVLILTESRKIFKQIAEEAQPVEISAKVKALWITPGCIYIGMAQTLEKRPLIMQQFSDLGENLIIINDEAHIGTQTKVLMKLRAAKLIGFTDTPDYQFAKHLPVLYKGIVVGPQPFELVQMGFLSPYYHFERRAADLSVLRIKDGEFSEKTQEDAFTTNEVYDGLVEDLREQKFRKCIVFTASVKHCNSVANMLREHGWNVAEVHTKNVAGDYELDRFMDHTSDVNVCVSVGQLTKGFDAPAIDLVILQRATTSLPLYLQMCGRGSRISGPTGKKKWTVLDYGGNGTRHGLWDMERPWSEMWLPPKNKKKTRAQDGVSPVKTCPTCGALLPKSAPVCGFCDHVFVKEEKEVQEGILVELTGPYSQIRGKKLSELNPEELAVFARYKGKRLHAIRVAKAREREFPGFLGQFGKAMEYKDNWVLHQINSMNGADKIDFFDIVLV